MGYPFGKMWETQCHLKGNLSRSPIYQHNLPQYQISSNSFKFKLDSTSSKKCIASSNQEWIATQDSFAPISIGEPVQRTKHWIRNWDRPSRTNGHHWKPSLWRLDGKVTRFRPWLRSRAPGFGWNCSQNSSFEGRMERSPAPGFGWNCSQNSSFEDSMARSRAPGFGWNCSQNSSFEGRMERSHAPGFGWNCSQNTSFQDSMARSPALVETAVKTQAS